jgi:hypothetical protein
MPNKSAETKAAPAGGISRPGLRALPFMSHSIPHRCILTISHHRSLAKNDDQF